MDKESANPASDSSDKKLIFICWSGIQSHAVARAVEELLKPKFPSVFVSDHVEKGVHWFESIVDYLKRSQAGIVCLTPESVQNPWLHFEAGALAVALPCFSSEKQVEMSERRLFTILHGVTAAELKGPLNAYQATSTTRDEMVEAIRSLGRALGTDNIPSDAASVISDDDWRKFEAALAEATLPVPELIPGFESFFQRKTFNEPVQRCPDQAWLRRYEGTQITRERLEAYLPRVRALCSAHERGIFEMLLVELDAYAMATQTLLLMHKDFTLNADGELDMDAGIRRCCEDRRLAIRSLVSRLVPPVERPQKEEAVRFMAADTDEERKMIVHHLEGSIRREREPSYKKPEKIHTGLQQLTRNQKPITLRQSSWDLDRIFYYMLVQYYGTIVLRWEPGGTSIQPENDDAGAKPYEVLCAVRDLEMEVERYRSKLKGGSTMPLTYALVALQSVAPEAALNDTDEGLAAKSALTYVEKEFERLLLQNVHHPIRRLLDDMLPPRQNSEIAMTARNRPL